LRVLIASDGRTAPYTLPWCSQGEVIQWMGKRYKATTTIAYPNNECAPDNPTDWCASWFEPDGDC